MSEYRLKFLPKSKEFLECTLPEVIFSGGYGSSKSVSLCSKIVFLATRYPKNRVFIGRKYLQDFKATTYRTLLEGDGALPPILPPEYIASWNKTDRVIRLKNDSEIFYDGIDIEGIKSLNISAAGIDECGELTEEEWNALTGRLRLSGVPIFQLFGATNPYSEYHWIWNRFKVNPPRDEFGNPTAKLIQSSTLDNNYLPKAYIENLKRTLFGHYYLRYVLGQWVGADSLVFDNFNAEFHVIPDFEIPKQWPRYRAIDFGYRSPFSCGWFTRVMEPDTDRKLKAGDVIQYREIYYTQRTTTVNAEKIKEYSIYPDGSPEIFKWTVCDHDAGDRADLEAVGIRTIKANKKEKDKAFRIQKVRQRLGNPKPQTGQQKVTPTFFVFENSLVETDPKIRVNLETGEKTNDPTRLSEEFMAYSWKPKSKDGIQKDEPEDKFDHAIDRTGYFFAEFDGEKQWADVPFRKI